MRLPALLLLALAATAVPEAMGQCGFHQRASRPPAVCVALPPALGLGLTHPPAGVRVISPVNHPSIVSLKINGYKKLLPDQKRLERDNNG